MFIFEFSLNSLCLPSMILKTDSFLFDTNRSIRNLLNR